MARRWPKGYVHWCELCGCGPVSQPGAFCTGCWKWMSRYTGHRLYGRDTLLIRQIHALRQRVAQELPLFKGGKLCV